MALRKVRKEKVKRILLVSLTNVGDVILTFPVLDILKNEFPRVEISVVVGPKAESLFANNPNLYKVYVYNKKQSLLTSVKWLIGLSKEKYDLVVDLRNSSIPYFMYAKYRTSWFMPRRENEHMRDQHIRRLRSVWKYSKEDVDRISLYISNENKEYIKSVKDNEIKSDRYIVVAPGAAHNDKRFEENKYASVCDRLIEDHDLRVVLVGDSNDKDVCVKVACEMKNEPIDLSSRTSLTQLAELMKGSLFVISNDSSPMHLASYLDKPVLGIFGPSDPVKYGPWSENSNFIKKFEICSACSNTKEKLKHTCMEAIKVEDVLNSFSVRADEIIFNE